MVSNLVLKEHGKNVLHEDRRQPACQMRSLNNLHNLLSLFPINLLIREQTEVLELQLQSCSFGRTNESSIVDIRYTFALG